MRLTSSEAEIERHVVKISATLDSIFNRIQIVSDRLKRVWQQGNHSGKQIASRDITQIITTVEGVLADAESYMVGAGVVFTPGALSDQQMYLEWRHYGDKGELIPLELNFYQGSKSYYDYTNRSWFKEPHETGMAYIEGPYIDLFGQNNYILTFAVPVLVDDEFVGIAGADIVLAELEEALTASLLGAKASLVIITNDARVVASSSADWSPGEIVRSELNRIECSYDLKLTQKLKDGWKLLVIPGKTA